MTYAGPTKRDAPSARHGEGEPHYGNGIPGHAASILSQDFEQDENGNYKYQ
jgi:hypothetical protein